MRARTQEPTREEEDGKGSPSLGRDRKIILIQGSRSTLLDCREESTIPSRPTLSLIPAFPLPSERPRNKVDLPPPLPDTSCTLPPPPSPQHLPSLLSKAHTLTVSPNPSSNSIPSPCSLIMSSLRASKLSSESRSTNACCRGRSAVGPTRGRERKAEAMVERGRPNEKERRGKKAREEGGSGLGRGRKEAEACL